MPNQILVPSLGESVTEATVSKWFKQVGESVNSDEPLVELETDKVNIEVPSPLSGTLSSIDVKEGDTVEVGALLGIIKNGQSSSTSTSTSTSKEKNDQQKEYLPPKTTKKSKKTHTKEQNLLKLVNDVEEKNENKEHVILDNLAENEISNTDISKESEEETK